MAGGLRDCPYGHRIGTLIVEQVSGSTHDPIPDAVALPDGIDATERPRTPLVSLATRCDSSGNAPW
jgi:hypothetical protein